MRLRTLMDCNALAMIFRIANSYTGFLTLLLLFSSCATGKLYIKPGGQPVQINEEPGYTIYAVGDAGELNEQARSVMTALSKVSSDDHQPGMVLFLGDNIYPSGCPPETATEARKYAEAVLQNQYGPLHAFKGELVFIAGNHDWNEFKPGGRDAVIRQSNLLLGLNDERIRFIPKAGCAGPEGIQLTPEIFMIIADSQWWLQDWRKETDLHTGCETQSKEEFISAFRKLVKDHEGQQIIVVMHHPLYTQGGHGGHFTVRDHLFPLSKAVDWLYLPLPVIGSIYPLYRSIFGHPQDSSHPRYRALKEAVLNSLPAESEVIFLAGHDHNLQYIRKENDHFILSGAGSKLNSIADHKDLIYGHRAPGFVQLDFFKNSGARLTVFELRPGSDEPEEVFSRLIISNP